MPIFVDLSRVSIVTWGGVKICVNYRLHCDIALSTYIFLYKAFNMILVCIIVRLTTVNYIAYRLQFPNAVVLK